MAAFGCQLIELRATDIGRIAAEPPLCSNWPVSDWPLSGLIYEKRTPIGEPRRSVDGLLAEPVVKHDLRDPFHRMELVSLGEFARTTHHQPLVP